MNVINFNNIRPFAMGKHCSDHPCMVSNNRVLKRLVCEKKTIFEENKKMLDDRFSFVKHIGRGSFGQVIRALDLNELRTVAIKIQKKKHDLDSIRRESFFCRHFCRHENILRVYGVYETLHELHIVMEEGEWNLVNFIREHPNSENIPSIALQIAQGLEWIHSNHFVHTDLKPENIVVNTRPEGGFHARIIDFGQSRNIQELISDEVMTIDDFPYLTTRWYRSPEMILGAHELISTKIDIWGFACVVMFMRLGTDIFRGSNELDMLCWFDAVLGEIPQTLVDLAHRDTRVLYFRLPKNKLVYYEEDPYDFSSISTTVVESLAHFCDNNDPDALNDCFRVLDPKLKRTMLYTILEKLGRQHLRIRFDLFFENVKLQQCIRQCFDYISTSRLSAHEIVNCLKD